MLGVALAEMLHMVVGLQLSPASLLDAATMLVRLHGQSVPISAEHFYNTGLAQLSSHLATVGAQTSNSCATVGDLTGQTRDTAPSLADTRPMPGQDCRNGCLAKRHRP